MGFHSGQRPLVHRSCRTLGFHSGQRPSVHRPCRALGLIPGSALPGCPTASHYGCSDCRCVSGLRSFCICCRIVLFNSLPHWCFSVLCSTLLLELRSVIQYMYLRSHLSLDSCLRVPALRRSPAYCSEDISVMQPSMPPAKAGAVAPPPARYA